MPRSIISKTQLLESVSLPVVLMAVLTKSLIRVKTKSSDTSSLQVEISVLRTVFVEILNVLIISNSEIFETSSELIRTSSELISTIAELISTIAESFLEIARSVAQQWQTDGKSKVLFLMYFYL